MALGSISLSITPSLSCHRPRKSAFAATPRMSASGRSHNDDPNCNCGGRRRRLVDEDMIVLRKRIHEMTMVERNYEPAADWMEWEKRYYTSYDSIVCDALGVLQSVLMNTRPSVALAVVVLTALSLPASAAFVVVHAAEVIKKVVEAGICI